MSKIGQKQKGGRRPFCPFFQFSNGICSLSCVYFYIGRLYQFIYPNQKPETKKKPKICLETETYSKNNG